jgi:hypothetical protein
LDPTTCFLLRRICKPKNTRAAIVANASEPPTARPTIRLWELLLELVVVWVSVVGGGDTVGGEVELVGDEVEVELIDVAELDEDPLAGVLSSSSSSRDDKGTATMVG